MRSLLGFSFKYYRATLLGWLTARSPTGSVRNGGGGGVAPALSLRRREHALWSSRFDHTRLQIFSNLCSDDRSRNITEVIASLQQLDKDVRIQIPRHPHGYRIVPFSWDELRTIVKNKELSYLCRSIEHQYEYEIYKLHFQTKWESVQDHILCSKFGMQPEMVADSGRQRAPVDLDNLPENLHRMSLLPNEFPYFVEYPIQHWVLWKIGEDCSEEDVNWAKVEIQERIGPVSDFIHWINPPHLKSVPDIDHVHILCFPDDTLQCHSL